MGSETEPKSCAPVNRFAAADVEAVLRERGWIRHNDDAITEWLTRVTALLGPHAADRATLEGLVTLIFEYDARQIVNTRECQEVFARDGARDVLRMLAHEILSGGPIDSNRLKEIVTELRNSLPYSARDIFLPLRVVLTGRVGGGALDRIVLLLDRASEIQGLAPVKPVRARILEFCAALD